MSVRSFTTIAGLLAVVGLAAHMVRRTFRPDPLPLAAFDALTAAPTGAREPAAGVVSVPNTSAQASPEPASPDPVSANDAVAPGEHAAVARRPLVSGLAAGAPGGRAAASAAAPGDEPAVANVLARAALRLVGKDPEALVVWKRAINDPRLSADNRSDLIEDLNDEGYDGQDTYSEADLNMILARLDLIEREIPFAMDDTNAWAFTEAYQDLLGMLTKARADVAAAKAARR